MSMKLIQPNTIFDRSNSLKWFKNVCKSLISFNISLTKFFRGCFLPLQSLCDKIVIRYLKNSFCHLVNNLFRFFVCLFLFCFFFLTRIEGGQSWRPEYLLIYLLDTGIEFVKMAYEISAYRLLSPSKYVHCYTNILELKNRFQNHDEVSCWCSCESFLNS